MTSEEQLDKWVEGEPIHNKDRDECCPDFSCCRPELLADKKIRTAFKNGTEESRNELLGFFLGQGIATYVPKKKVHIAGLKPSIEN